MGVHSVYFVHARPVRGEGKIHAVCPEVEEHHGGRGQKFFPGVCDVIMRVRAVFMVMHFRFPVMTVQVAGLEHVDAVASGGYRCPEDGVVVPCRLHELQGIWKGERDFLFTCLPVQYHKVRPSVVRIFSGGYMSVGRGRIRIEEASFLCQRPFPAGLEVHIAYCRPVFQRPSRVRDCLAPEQFPQGRRPVEQSYLIGKSAYHFLFPVFIHLHKLSPLVETLFQGIEVVAYDEVLCIFRICAGFPGHLPIRQERSAAVCVFRPDSVVQCHGFVHESPEFPAGELLADGVPCNDIVRPSGIVRQKLPGEVRDIVKVANPAQGHVAESIVVRGVMPV